MEYACLQGQAQDHPYYRPSFFSLSLSLSEIGFSSFTKKIFFLDLRRFSNSSTFCDFLCEVFEDYKRCAWCVCVVYVKDRLRTSQQRFFQPLKPHIKLPSLPPSPSHNNTHQGRERSTCEQFQQRHTLELRV